MRYRFVSRTSFGFDRKLSFFYILLCILRADYLQILLIRFIGRANVVRLSRRLDQISRVHLVILSCNVQHGIIIYAGNALSARASAH